MVNETGEQGEIVEDTQSWEGGGGGICTFGYIYAMLVSRQSTSNIVKLGPTRRHAKHLMNEPVRALPKLYCSEIGVNEGMRRTEKVEA